MNILLLGAGAWGTALAIAAARRGGHEVSLWARDGAQASAMDAARENVRYLPGIALPPALRIMGGDVAPLVAKVGLVVIATPVSGLRGMLSALDGAKIPVAWLCKGFEAEEGGFGRLPHEVCRDAVPGLHAGVLSGPSFAQEVARGQPTALVAASIHADVRRSLVDAFHGPALRVYENEDVAGVEVGGAVKNVLAIATGLCDGLQLGLNARAALVTRGLAEMTRLGLALGGRVETFAGLSGLGDLVLTATGDLSRNRKVGLLLAKGLSQDDAVASLGHVAEGVYCARTVVQRARALGIEMPIAEGVVALLDGRLRAADAVAALMERSPAAENH